MTRQHVSSRLPAPLIEQIDRFAVDEDIKTRNGEYNRSEAIERLLAEGLEAVRARHARERKAKRRGAR